MTDTVIQARTVLPVGSRSFGPVVIPANVVWAGFVFSKANWTDQNVKLSLDITAVVDGVSIPLAGFKDEPGGGPDVGETKKIPTGANRQLSGVITVVGGNLDTVVSIRTLVVGEGRILL